MLRKSLIVVVLAIYLVSTANSQRDSDSDVGHGDDSFEDGDRNPILSDDDDMQEGHESESTPRRLGPFNTSLESGAISLRLFWTVLTEDKNNNEPTEIEFTLLTNASKIKWLAFGFTENKRFNEADWFVAWKSHRGRSIYTKVRSVIMYIQHKSLKSQRLFPWKNQGPLKAAFHFCRSMRLSEPQVFKRLCGSCHISNKRKGVGHLVR